MGGRLSDLADRIGGRPRDRQATGSVAALGTPAPVASDTCLVAIGGPAPESRVLPCRDDRFAAEMRDIRLKDFGVERFFAAFQIESSYRFIETLRSRATA